MNLSVPFLEEMKEAAENAKAAETSFRREAAYRIAALEQDRAFAFRRFNLMQAVAEAVASAESEEIAVVSALATLRARLGWTADSEAREEILAQFGPVALAVYRVLAPDEHEADPDVREALAVFESWYAESCGSPFWALFEHPMPDTPVVDF
jgi:hypothetical protein